MVAGLQAPNFNNTTIKKQVAQTLSGTSRKPVYSTAIPKTTSSVVLPSSTTSASTVGKIATSTGYKATTGYGIGAQRSNSPYARPDVSGTLANFNASTTPLILKDLMPSAPSISGPSNKASITDIMAGLNMIAATTMQITKDVKDAKGKQKTEDTGFNYGDISGGLASKLDKAESFGEIKNLEQTADKQAKELSSEYAKTTEKDTKAIGESIKNISAGLELAGANVDVSKLKTSTLNFNPDDISTYDDAARTINSDISGVDEFLNTEVKQGIAQCDTKINELSTQIQSLTAQINTAKSQGGNTAELEQKLKEAQDQKKSVEDAKGKLQNDVTKAADDMKKDLEAKLKDLGNVKEFKEEVADKKLELAKDHDKEISKNKKKMDNLLSDIKKLKGDSTKADKLKSKINEFNTLAGRMSELNASLNNIGDKTIKTSKFSYTMQNSSIETKYTTAYEDK